MVRVGHDKTFGINNPDDLLKKLEWEIGTLRDTSNSDITGLCYHAFNGVLTAWHMADWVWCALSDDQRASLKDGQGVKDQGGFRYWIRNTNKALAICREIATASKHFTVDRNPNDDIVTVASARAERVTDAKGEEIVTNSGAHVVTEAWVLKVDDGDGRHNIIDVLEEAKAFWIQFMDERKIARA